MAISAKFGEINNLIFPLKNAANKIPLESFEAGLPSHLVPTLFFLDPTNLLVHKPEASKKDYTTEAMMTFGSQPVGTATAPRSVFRMVKGAHT